MSGPFVHIMLKCKEMIVLDTVASPGCNPEMGERDDDSIGGWEQENGLIIVT